MRAMNFQLNSLNLMDSLEQVGLLLRGISWQSKLNDYWKNPGNYAVTGVFSFLGYEKENDKENEKGESKDEY